VFLKAFQRFGDIAESPAAAGWLKTGIFSVAVLGLGFFWIARDPERQAWHDKIAGTYVVKI
jgi:uncharacterized RDD family membrane protein YckC